MGLLRASLLAVIALLLRYKTDAAANDSQDVSTWMPIDLSTKPEGQDAAPTVKIDYVGYATVPTLLIIGLFGNFMTFTVMSYKGFCKMPNSLLLRAMSISDTTLIILLPFNKQFVMNSIGMDIRALSTPTCKLFFWAWKTSKMTSSWLVFTVTLERLVAVLLPMKAKLLITRRKVAVSITLVYIGIGGFNAIWESVATRMENGRCLPNIPTPGYEVIVRVFVVTGTFVYCYIPGAFILIFNFCIIRRLAAESRKRRKLAAEVKRKNDVTGRTTVMLLIVSFGFVVLVMPTGTMHILSIYGRINIYETSHLPMVVFREVTQVMELINYSINFFVYVLCCKKFRKHAVHIMSLSRFNKSGQRAKRSGDSTMSISLSIQENELSHSVVK
ncbi:hypothetical protein CAPTEDRAFT_188111 [Capitella teleta]|uniref:G-protein coupled receptors family 1 profile domain-containing protein n=1 Tax=Capitella teleta TaxID=283909 RepID=R7UZL3_CAPTE|nr:hypothetical protein CAPTEDRAFT_188111 [Capitella teleta]|eukprot:ELU12028.1 hypothetical protein CAPTEDRAFT_188111 [Capitella teleta]